MGKESFLEALDLLQLQTSIDGIRHALHQVYDAFRDLHRKRSYFLEDAFATVLRQTKQVIGTSLTKKYATICIELLEPLLEVDPEAEPADMTRQRGLMVAALLHLLGIDTTAMLKKDHQELRLRLVDCILACGVNMHVILATLRLREEITECCQIMLPHQSIDSETEDSDAEEDEAEDDGDRDDISDLCREDTQWMVHQVTQAWGLSSFEYFLMINGQEHAFAAWSTKGITVLAYRLFVEQPLSMPLLSVVIAPLSWLISVASYAHHMIQSEDMQMRYSGLEMVMGVLRLCRDESLHYPVKAKDRANDEEKFTSFKDRVAAFRQRDWVTSLIQLITNAMVSYPDPKDRLFALDVLKRLLSKFSMNERFYLLRKLVMQCPYGNVSAVLVDQLRSDTARAWTTGASLDSTPSPYMSAIIGSFLKDVLSQTSERDLVLYADLLASCMSLLRFLHIRDKVNITGVCTGDVADNIQDTLVRIHKRLRVKFDDATPLQYLTISDEESLRASPESARSHPGDGEYTHLLILEAAMSSTLQLWESKEEM